MDYLILGESDFKMDSFWILGFMLLCMNQDDCCKCHIGIIRILAPEHILVLSCTFGSQKGQLHDHCVSL